MFKYIIAFCKKVSVFENNPFHIPRLLLLLGGFHHSTDEERVISLRWVGYPTYSPKIFRIGDTDMITFYVGQLEEVRPQNRKNKETGVVTTSLEATVTFETKDKEGYLVKSTEQIQMEMSDIKALTDAKGKFIVIPYLTINTKNGTYTFPSDSLGFQIFDKNPLELKKPL